MAKYFSLMRREYDSGPNKGIHDNREPFDANNDDEAVELHHEKEADLLEFQSFDPPLTCTEGYVGLFRFDQGERVAKVR